jgi:hypothetical protein
VAARTVEVDLPAQSTLDQAIVALLKLRRGEVPGMPPWSSLPS